MGVAQLDELVNSAGLATFGEPVVFFVGGRARPANAVFEIQTVETSIGMAPVIVQEPVLLMREADLLAIGAKGGDEVDVRGRRHQLLEGTGDPIVDAGGMARIPIRPGPTS